MFLDQAEDGSSLLQRSFTADDIDAALASDGSPPGERNIHRYFLHIYCVCLFDSTLLLQISRIIIIIIIIVKITIIIFYY